MEFLPSPDRYDSMPYRRCGRSGVQLPTISVGPRQRGPGDRPVQEGTGRRAVAEFFFGDSPKAVRTAERTVQDFCASPLLEPRVIARPRSTPSAARADQ